MKLKKIVCLLLACSMILVGAAAFAEAPAAQHTVPVFYTSDEALLIQAPAQNWYELTDAGYWFAITNGTDLITINHLKPGDTLQAAVTADDKYSAVCHTFLSTRNDVFDVRGFAVNQDDISAIQRAIGTIRFLSLGFTVYGEDATTAWIMQTDGANTYTDTLGNTYSRLPDGLYQRNDTGMLYSTYPGYWGLNIGPETPDGKPFTVYGEDATKVSIYRTVGGYYMDANGNTYDRTRDGLFRRNSDSMLYSADPGYWNNSEGPDTPDGGFFTVYGEDGTSAEIYPTVGGYYLDSKGNIFDKTADGLYRNHDSKLLYSASPDYWNNDRGPETRDGEDFIVYGENDSTLSIYPVVGGYYMDYDGNAYDLTNDGLYRRHNGNALYSADPGYWNDRGPETREGDAFAVYGEDGTKAYIFPVAGGYYMDASNNSYDPSSDGLYTRHDNGMLYSADPGYWNVSEPEEDMAEDEPAADEPVQDEPVYDEPVQDEPVYDEPVYDEPVYDEPVQDEPVYDEPVYDEPVYDEPAPEADD